MSDILITVDRSILQQMYSNGCVNLSLVHFTVMYLVAKPLNRSEAEGDLVMIQTLLLLKCKLICYHAN